MSLLVGEVLVGHMLSRAYVIILAITHQHVDTPVHVNDTPVHVTDTPVYVTDTPVYVTNTSVHVTDTSVHVLTHLST